ncbi:MAG: PRC-barrel domain-containing protein [Halovenus sp.]
MADILAENLSEKAVIGDGGTELGMLYNITMDPDSGRLQNLLVSPNEGSRGNLQFETDAQGRYLVPVGRINDVDEHIIIEQ